MAGEREEQAPRGKPVDKDPIPPSLGERLVIALGEPVLLRTSSNLSGTPVSYSMLNPAYLLGFSLLSEAVTDSQADPSTPSLLPGSSPALGEGLGKFTRASSEGEITPRHRSEFSLDIRGVEDFEEKYLFPLAVVVDNDPDNSLADLLMSYVSARGGEEVAGSPPRMRREYQVLVSRFNQFKEKGEDTPKLDFPIPASDRTPLLPPEERPL